jgi:hypothetical protein
VLGAVPVAAKEMYGSMTDEDEVREFLTEVSVLKNIRHPYVLGDHFLLSSNEASALFLSERTIGSADDTLS